MLIEFEPVIIFTSGDDILPTSNEGGNMPNREQSADTVYIVCEPICAIRAIRAIRALTIHSISLNLIYF